VVDDPDAMWKPGGELHVDDRESASATVASDINASPGDTAVWARPTRLGASRRPRTMFVALACALGAAALAVVSFWPSGGNEFEASTNLGTDVERSEPAVGSPFGNTKRLPDSVDTRWATAIDGVVATADSSVFVERRELVVAVFDGSDPLTDSASAVVVGIAGSTGDERWRTLLGSGARDLSVVGVTNEVVVVERRVNSDLAVLGIDTAGGRVLWERQPSRLDEHVLLPGVGLVVAVASSPDDELVFIDAITGEAVGAVSGALLSSDGSGRWYVRESNRVAELDLRTGWSPPTAVGQVDVPDTVPVAVIDRRLVTPGRSGLVEVERSDSPGARLPFVPDVDELQAPSALIQFNPIAGTSFILTGGGSVFGATLGSGDVDITWRVFGAVINSSPSDRGLLLNVASDSGGVQRVVDGSSGEVVASVGMVPGARDGLEMVANGVLLKRASGSGFERVGIDLDGDERWALEGDSPIAIGDRLLVTYRPGIDGAVLIASGDAR